LCILGDASVTHLGKTEHALQTSPLFTGAEVSLYNTPGGWTVPSQRKWWLITMKPQ
jgi:hypothetical protein